MAPGLLDTDEGCLSKRGKNILAHGLAGLIERVLTWFEGGGALNKDKIARDENPWVFWWSF